MTISVTCRHDAVGPAARAHAEKKAHKLDGLASDIQVVFDEEPARRFSAGLIVTAADGAVVALRAVADSATAAFDAALRRVVRRLRERKS